MSFISIFHSFIYIVVTILVHNRTKKLANFFQRNVLWQFHTLHDGPPSSLMNSAASLKKKTTEGEGIGVRSLACNISGVEGRARVSGWD